MRKKQILENLKRQQTDAADRLKSYLTRVIAEAERVLEKIEKEGAESYYSCNSPLHEWVDQAWKASLTLSELRRIQTRFEDEDRRKKKPKKPIS